MHRPFLTRLGRCAAAATVAAALAAFVPTALAAKPRAAPTAVNGLIVQLRDAPTHVELERERALSRAGGALAAREQARWEGVMAHAQGHAGAARIAERRPVMASAQLLRFERPLSVAQAQALADRLAQRGEVAWAVPNVREQRLQAANAPTDPFFSGLDNQWWLQPRGGSDGVNIVQRLRGVPGFQTAWTSVTTGSANAIVAVLDNGYTGHPDLTGKIIPGYDMVGDVAFSNDGNGRDDNPSDPGDWVSDADLARPEYDGCVREDSSWHGTAIAGMLAANVNNGQGVASMNWPGRVLVVRVASKCGADVVDIVDGMRWAAGLPVSGLPINPNPARVISISFGGTGSCDAYQDAINDVRAAGGVIVAAAGNEFAASATRPAKCPGVIGVAALNRDGLKSNYSNFGPEVALATVGGDDTDGVWGGLLGDSGLLTVGNDGRTGPGAPGYYYYYGTSFSTPIVAGAASLMLSVNPALTSAQVEQGLRVSARPHVTSSLGGTVAACSNANPGRCLCTTSTCGSGILDVPRALAYAANPGGYVATPLQAEVNNSTELATAATLGADRPPNSGGSNPPPSNGGDGGGGGGALSSAWLAALLLACGALWRRPRRQGERLPRR